VYVSACVHTRAFVCVCVCVRGACVRACMHDGYMTCFRRNLHVCVCVHIYTYVHVRVNACVCACMHDVYVTRVKKVSRI